jgi:hypothetical protein
VQIEARREEAGVMPAVQSMVGDRLYLFTDGSPNRGESLVISSHGAYVPGRNRGADEGNGWFKVPSWTTLDFYVVHGKALEDPTITSVTRYRPVETLGPGALVRNYRLFKYQGRHGSRDETYETIRARIDDNRQLAAQRDAERAGATQEQRDSGLLDPIHRYDVLTIRYRGLPGVIGFTLRDVLRELDTYGRRYTRIRCAFCRSSILGDTPWTSLNK